MTFASTVCRPVQVAAPAESHSACAAIPHIVKLFANMINIVPEIVKHLRDTHGAYLSLARIAQNRLLLAEAAEESASRPAEAADDAADIIGSDELLSLTLAILTSACIADMEFAGTMARSGQLPSLIFPSMRLPDYGSAFEPGCLGRGSCLRTCQCQNARPLGVTLAELYHVYAAANTVSTSSQCRFKIQ